MKILVLGGSSLLGSKLVKSLNRKHNVVYTFNNLPLRIEGSEGFKLDATEREDTFDFIRRIKPDRVIDTVAVRGTDLCETDNALADKVNVGATQNIIDACKRVGAHVVYVSTAFVFDGKKQIFTEDDQPNPVNYYGKTRLEAEKIALNSDLHTLVIRTDQLYGWTMKGQAGNTATKILQKLEGGEDVEEISDWYNNPTFVDNAVQVMVKLIGKQKSGIYHVVGSDFLNRVEWSMKLAKIFGYDEKLIKSKRSEKLNLPAKRPNANLSNEKAQRDSGIKLISVDEGLKVMREQVSKA